MSPAPRASLAILLHGVGASGRDLAPLADALERYLPGTQFATPDAPHAFDEGPGRQWFSVAGVSAQNRPQRVAAARAEFDRVVNAELDRFGLSGEPERVALIGFSQGAIMALDALATGRWPVAAVVAFSGRLATPAPLQPPAGARALLVHGADDSVIPAEETRQAAARLAQAGVAVESRLLPGLGHTISLEGVALAGAFVAGRPLS
jgi:phospholipase/carboxylesterase